MALLNTNIGPERVQVFDVPTGVVQVPGASTSVTAFLISTTEAGAPVNTPTRVTNLDDFVATFGGPDEIADDAYYAVQGYYDNAGSGAVAIIVNVGDGVHATGTTTITSFSNLLVTTADTIEVAGVVFTAQAGSVTLGAATFQAATSNGDTAASLATQINNHTSASTLVSASVAGATVTITSKLGGTIGNSYTLVYTDNGSEIGATVSGSTLSGGLAVSANDYIGSAADSSGLRALDAQDDLALVCIPGLPLATAFLVQPALIDYTETVRAEFGATLSTSFSLLAMPKEIGKADSDVTVITTKFISSTGTGPYVVSVEDVVAGGVADLSGITPGMILTDAAGSFTAVISAVNDTTDEITVITDPSGAFVATDDVLIKVPSAVTYKETVINNPSRTAAWYFNNLVVTDRASAASPGDVVVVDASGHVAGVMGRIDANVSIGGVSHAPAGIQFAGLAGIIGLSLALSERIDAEPLRLNFINRITSFPGAGNIIFGGYTADSGTSPTLTADEQLIQVMRAVQFIKASLEPGLRAFLWENFSPETQTQVERSITSFLRNNSYLFPAGLPESQQFQVVRVEATQDELDQGLLRVRVLIKPNKAVRFIEVALEFPLPTA